MSPDKVEESVDRAAAGRWDSGTASVAQADPAENQAMDLQPADKQSASVMPQTPPRTPAPKVPVRWAWNRPLLAVSLVGLVLGTVLLVGLYHWQSGRVGEQLRQLVDAARANQNAEQEVQWLQRYLVLRPDDVEAQIELVWAFDAVASSPAEIDQARRYFNRAIAAASEESDTRDALRRRLIDRLLQLGGGWCVEAERQIILLNAPPEDPDALAQLAKSLLGQSEDTDSRGAASDSSTPRHEHYWKWAAAQSVGDILRASVEANPDSTALAAALVEVYLDRPELFDSRGGSVNREGFSEQAAKLLQRLSQQKDDGRAQWVTYYYGSRGSSSVATEPLAVKAALALKRLQKHAASSKTTKTAEGGEPQAADANGTSGGNEDSQRFSRNASNAKEEYEPHWDARLVLTHAASLAGAASFGDAEDFYEAMTSLPDEIISDSQLELAYRGLGQVRWQLGKFQAAKEAWQIGNERQGGESPLLLEPLAALAVQSAPLEEAKQTVEQLAGAIEKASVGLAGAVGTRMAEKQRSELQARLRATNWRTDVLRAQLDLREGDYRLGSSRLERALASQASVGTPARLEASELLARMYGEQGLWDLAGRVLDEAVLLTPNDKSLRKRAADAWEQASVPSRAAGQLQHADDGTFEAALAYARVVTATMTTTAPALRNLAQVHSAIAEAERRLKVAVEEGKAPQAAWRLELLKLVLSAASPAAAVASQDPQKASNATDESDPVSRQPQTQRILELSAQYPQAPELQAIAALGSLQQGDPDAADEALQRLESIPQVEPLFVLETQARLAAHRGEADEAVEKLRTFAASHPEHHLRAIKFAANLLDSAGQRGKAAALLLEVEPQQRDRAHLIQLGDWLLDLEDSPASTESCEPDIDRLAELQEVERQLRALEGEAGTHWRWIAASRLLQRANGSEKAPQLLYEAAQLHAEIAARRPRWSRGLALGGRIAVAEGNPQRAVDSLRRALAEGDQEIGTVMLLVRQLNRIGEVGAAEQELARLEHLADSVGPIAALAVGVAVGQGQYERALERARSGVRSRPNDPAALLILAQTAASAAKTDDQQTASLLSEAAKALEKAIELTQGENVSVWDAQFRFKLTTEGAAAARGVLVSIESSRVADRDRWLAVARGYLAIQDWEEARSRLEKAKQANPSDANVFLSMADLHRATNDSEAMLEALETANRLAPDRTDIRRRLAFALVANHSAEISWTRISQLIGTDRADATGQDQLYHALIVLARGDDQQIEQASEQLQRLMHSNDPSVADDAARLLITVERRHWARATKRADLAAAQDAISKCRKLYAFLTQRTQPNPADIYGYGDLLLNTERTAEVGPIADQLSAVAPGTRVALNLRLRYAKQSGNEAQLAALADNWLQEPANQDSPSALSVAGQELSRLNSHDYSIKLLERAYQEDPRLVQDYVAVLSKAGEIKRAITVCMTDFRKNHGPESIATLAGLMATESGSPYRDADVEHVLAAGVKEFPANIRVLESMGTLCLIQQRYAESITFYTQAEKIRPGSLLTLNNLAMALSEVPGREDEGVPRIQRAIELYGPNPELLDTLGVVQFRCKQLAEAESTLRHAWSESQDARHLFHLLLVLEAREDTAELQRLWAQLDLEKLKPAGLTPNERSQLEGLLKQLGKPRPV